MTAPTEAPDVEDAIKARLLDVLDESVAVVYELVDGGDNPTPRPAVEVAIVGGAPVVEGIVSSSTVAYTTHAGDDRALARKVARDTVAALRAGSVWPSWSAGGYRCSRGDTISDPVHHRDPNTREHSFSGTVQLIMRRTG